MTRVSIDAMGGDYAPQGVTEGLSYFCHHFDAEQDVESFVLHGDQEQLRPLLSQYPKLEKKCEIVHTDQAIGMDMAPVQAMRKLRRSSMRLAIESVRDKTCQFCVSAGNTGALMAHSKTQLRMISGLERPAICTSLPAKNGRRVAVLDLGADVYADAKRLTEFAIMGTTYAKILNGYQTPRVALLNIGTESVKGRVELIACAHMLENAFKELVHFTGFVEGTCLLQGEVDVVVTDGFTGNNVLKTIEGLASMFFKEIVAGFGDSTLGKLRLLAARKGLKAFHKIYDPRQYNGAVLLGLNGIVIKSHGRADPFAYASAINTGMNLARGSFIEELSNTIAPFIPTLNAIDDLNEQQLKVMVANLKA